MNKSFFVSYALYVKQSYLYFIMVLFSNKEKFVYLSKIMFNHFVNIYIDHHQIIIKGTASY